VSRGRSGHYIDSCLLPAPKANVKQREWVASLTISFSALPAITLYLTLAEDPDPVYVGFIAPLALAPMVRLSAAQLEAEQRAVNTQVATAA
jgi:hypothetical protein